MERHILTEWTSSCPTPSSRIQGVSTFVPPCKVVRDDPIDCVSLARQCFSALCLNLTTWSSRGPLLVTHLFDLSALTRRQLAKAHGVTWKEPKIHVICYITDTCYVLITYPSYTQHVHREFLLNPLFSKFFHSEWFYFQNSFIASLCLFIVTVFAWRIFKHSGNTSNTLWNQNRIFF